MEKEIKLPTKLAKVGLSHEEIGSLFVLLSLDDMNAEEKLLWEEDQALQNTIPKLIDRKIVKIDGENLQVDLTFLDPEEPFWTVLDYDAYDNPIYGHPSSYGADSDGSSMYFRVKPVLCSGEIMYVYCGDKELVSHRPDILDCGWDSLDDAQKSMEDLLREESNIDE